MKNRLLTLYVKIQGLKDALADDNGQDMVEYGLVLGLVALAATAAMSGFSTTISTAFTHLGTKLTTATS